MADKFYENYTQCEKIGSKYVNKWGEWPHGFYTGLSKLFKWIWTISKISLRDNSNASKDLPIIKPNFDYKSRRNNSNIIVTWFGHASILLEIEGFTILCDPVFGETCGPLGLMRRYRDAPCKVKDLPVIDAVVISHNHYDHMDAETIKMLSDHQENLKWYIPIGDKSNLCGMITDKNIYEMKWWDELEITKAERKLKIVFTPTQHWSNRGLLDVFKSLWGSYAFVGENTKFWFGGDTGYCGAFKEIGRKYGPFTGAAIPIGAYKPRDLLKFQHCDPNEAVQIHEDIKSEVSIGIHWGTFMLSEEGYMEPKEDLEKSVREKSLEKEIKFITIKHGETLLIKDKEYELLEHQQNEESRRGFTLSTFSLGDDCWVTARIFHTLCDESPFVQVQRSKVVLRLVILKENL